MYNLNFVYKLIPKELDLVISIFENEYIFVLYKEGKFNCFAHPRSRMSLFLKCS